jgi:hypothetical protein
LLSIKIEEEGKKGVGMMRRKYRVGRKDDVFKTEREG